MKNPAGFDGINYSDWLILTMLIELYGEEKLIATLNKVKETGLKNIKLWEKP